MAKEKVTEKNLETTVAEEKVTKAKTPKAKATKEPKEKVAEAVVEEKVTKKTPRRVKAKEKEEVVEPVREPVTEARAVAKTVRLTPRKARLVIDLVRGMKVSEALALLANVNRSATTPVVKTIKSAAANAVNNFKMNEDELFIKEIYANDGLRMKRYRPRAKGSASGIIKRTCHITVVVGTK
ncbi:MAG: 50S ribosomal protein L22 [Bacilli bacterium]|jgi:large subunit ribosomal protein L22